MIVGSGWVGRQIAARIAMHGMHAYLVDRSLALCNEALRWVHALGDPASQEGHDLAARVHSLGTLKESLAAPPQVQLIIECAPEQVSIKRRILSEVSEQFASDVIIASNSSYFVPSMLAQYVHLPNRFANLHFHVPVLHDSICDIVGCEQTEDSVTLRLRDFVLRLGLEPLVLRHEHPGYVFNWLLQSVLKAALELVAQDVVDPEDVDKAWTTITGMQQGPFGIMDKIGLDVIEQVLSNSRWVNSQPVSIENLLQVIKPLTSSGKLGVKSLQGFYSYEDDSLVTKRS